MSALSERLKKLKAKKAGKKEEPEPAVAEKKKPAKGKKRPMTSTSNQNSSGPRFRVTINAPSPIGTLDGEFEAATAGEAFKKACDKWYISSTEAPKSVVKIS